MKKIEKNDWFTEGFKILETEGFARITIENLCERLQITKGSFYHHFKNTDGYVAALMDYWLEENTISIIRKVDTARSVRSKKKILDKLALDRSLKLEQNIRAWGFSNHMVMQQVQKVDKIRLDYLIDMEVQSGKKHSIAMDVAILTYATLVGLQQLFPDLSKTEQIRLNQYFSTKF